MQFTEAAIAASVVDIDDLGTAIEPTKSPCQLAVKERKALLLVEDRDNNR
jgi:hypothetical protein